MSLYKFPGAGVSMRSFDRYGFEPRRIDPLRTSASEQRLRHRSGNIDGNRVTTAYLKKLNPNYEMPALPGSMAPLNRVSSASRLRQMVADAQRVPAASGRPETTLGSIRKPPTFDERVLKAVASLSKLNETVPPPTAPIPSLAMDTLRELHAPPGAPKKPPSQKPQTPLKPMTPLAQCGRTTPPSAVAEPAS